MDNQRFNMSLFSIKFGFLYLCLDSMVLMNHSLSNGKAKDESASRIGNTNVDP